MKNLTLPQKRKDYIPKGVYALPINERKKFFEKLLCSTSEPVELTEYRLRELRRMRGGNE